MRRHLGPVANANAVTVVVAATAAAVAAAARLVGGIYLGGAPTAHVQESLNETFIYSKLQQKKETSKQLALKLSDLPHLQQVNSELSLQVFANFVS